MTKYLTVTEAAAMIGKSKRAVQHDVCRGKIPHSRIGRRVVISETELAKFLSLLPTVSAKQAAARVAQG